MLTAPQHTDREVPAMTHFTLTEFNAKRAGQAALQRGLNDLADELGLDVVADLIREVAAAEHVEHRQYDGYWDGWSVAVAQHDLATKGGEAFVAGDVVLYEYRRGLCGCPADVTAYSVRLGWNVSVGSTGLVRWWEAA